MLNDTKIKSAKATGKRFELVDGAGLYLDITASGTKVWRYRYRLLGKREKVTIGAYPAVPLTEARARRAELEAMVVRGKSPAREIVREKQQANQAGTVSELADIYKEDLAKRSKNVTGCRDWIFSAYITPKLGRFPLADITPSDVLNFLNGIKKDAPASALAVHGTLKRMFDLAIGNQLMTSNPVAAIPPNVIAQKKSRIRALSPEEIATLLRSLDDARGEPTTINAFRLLLLTMVRRNELLASTWGEFDLENALWTIPGERTKNGKAHVVPLSTQVITILRELLRGYGVSGLVLPGRLPSKPLSTGTLHESMTRNKDFAIARFTPHDFRRTASTILHEQGWNTDVIEKALNHTMRGVRGVYNKAEYLDQRREMLQSWANYLDALKSGAKVIPIGAGKAA